MSYTFYFSDLEVITSKKYINQDIKSRGGGGYIIDGSGRINAPEIYSETSVQVETFLRKENGEEVQLTVNKDIALRDGHNVRLFSVWNESDKGFYVALYNKETKVVDYFVSDAVLREMTSIKKKLSKWIKVLFFFPLYFLFLYYLNTFHEEFPLIAIALFFGLFAGFSFYDFLIKLKNKKTTSAFMSDLKHFVSQNV